MILARDRRDDGDGCHFRHVAGGRGNRGRCGGHDRGECQLADRTASRIVLFRRMTVFMRMSRAGVVVFARTNSPVNRGRQDNAKRKHCRQDNIA